MYTQKKLHVSVQKQQIKTAIYKIYSLDQAQLVLSQEVSWVFRREPEFKFTANRVIHCVYKNPWLSCKY